MMTLTTRPAFLSRWLDSLGEASKAREETGADPERVALVNRILEITPMANPEFLAGFEAHELREYLDHLRCCTQPRGRLARWVRPDNLRGIEVSDARA